MKYMVYGFDEYYPMGDMNDLIGFYNEDQEIEILLNDKHGEYDYIQIVEIETWKITHYKTNGERYVAGQ